MARFNPTDYDPDTDGTPGVSASEYDLDQGVLIIREQSGCPCGCGQDSKGKRSEFVQGHDARLKGILIRAHITGQPVHIVTPDGITTHDAMTLAAERGWERFLTGAEGRYAPKHEPVPADATKAQLVEIAKDRGVEVPAKARKADLLALLS